MSNNKNDSMDLAHTIKSKINAIYFMVDGMVKDYSLNHEGVLAFIDETNDSMGDLIDQIDNLGNCTDNRNDLSANKCNNK